MKAKTQAPAETTTSWSSQVQSIGGVPLFPGFLEPTWGCIDVVEKLCDAIHNPRGILPQKYLYASLHGARLWKQLCEGDSHIAQVYRKFPLNAYRSDLAAKFRSQAERMMKGHTNKKLGVVALGAGTGKREAQICGWLVEELGLEHLSALVLDVSSELLGVSLREFKTAEKRIHPHFAVMDFESHSGLAHLEWLRRKWGGHPVLFLLLGNTFGNIDESVFLRHMAGVMRDDDLMLCESSFVADTEARKPYNAENDVRAEFICDPLRSLGINPKSKNLQRHVTSKLGKWVKQEFQYHFDDEDAGLSLSVSPRPTISNKSSVGLLEIQALTASHASEVFSEVFSCLELVEHEYPVESPSASKVRMGYVFASAPHRGAVSELAGTAQGEAKGSVPIEIDSQKLEYTLAGVTGKLCATHLALVAVLSQQPPGSTTRDAKDIRNDVITWLEEYKSNGGTLKGQQANRLKNLKEDKEGKDAQGASVSLQRTISPLKKDTFDGLKDKSEKHCKAAAILLKIWPEKGWSFKAESV